MSQTLALSCTSIFLFQAARVNSVCNRFKKIALESRVFGYKGASLLELDSFMNFVGQARLRVRLVKYEKFGYK